ncbi:MAG: hypothetical protein NVSMB7_03210 [Chitinophagaceae bacterium]
MTKIFSTISFLFVAGMYVTTAQVAGDMRWTNKVGAATWPVSQRIFNTADIDKDVTLLGSQHFDDYPEIDTRIAGIEMKWPAALINIIDAEEAALTGKGTIAMMMIFV